MSKSIVARGSAALLCAGALVLGGAGPVTGMAVVQPGGAYVGVEQAMAADSAVDQHVQFMRYVIELVSLENELDSVSRNIAGIPACKEADIAEAKAMADKIEQLKKDIQENPLHPQDTGDDWDSYTHDQRVQSLVDLQDEYEYLQIQIDEYDKKLSELESKKTVLESRIAELNQLIYESSSVEEAKPAAVKAVALKSRKVKVTWKAPKGLSGLTYQLSYKVKGKRAKTVTVQGTSKVIKKLPVGKKATLKVRGFKEVGGKVVFTKWSAAKTVRVRK